MVCGRSREESHARRHQMKVFLLMTASFFFPEHATQQLESQLLDLQLGSCVCFMLEGLPRASGAPRTSGTGAFRSPPTLNPAPCLILSFDQRPETPISFSWAAETWPASRWRDKRKLWFLLLGYASTCGSSLFVSVKGCALTKRPSEVAWG